MNPPFPIAWRASRFIASPTGEHIAPRIAAARLAAALAREGAKLVQSDSDTTVTFRNPFLFGANRNSPIAAVSSGVLVVSESSDTIHLEFEVRFTNVLLFSLAVAALILGVSNAHSPFNAEGSFFALLAFLWLFGVNVLFVFFRLPRFFRKSLAQTGAT
jgi:hypothetical protein